MINSFNIPKCKKIGCLNPPIKVPVLCVPRKGIPLDKQTPIKATIDWPLCQKHIGEPTVRELLTENMRQMFIIQTKINNSNPPDFDKAWIEATRMDSKRYLDVIAQKRRRGVL